MKLSYKVFAIIAFICCSILNGRTATAEITVRMNPGGGDANISLLAGGTRILTRSGDAELLWDAKTGAPLGRLSLPGSKILCMTIAPDNNSIATSTADGNVQIWDPKTASIIKTLTQANAKYTSPYVSLTYTNSGKTIVAETNQMYAGTVDIYTVADNTIVHLPKETNGYYPLAFTDDEKFVQLRRYDQPSKWYDMTAGLAVDPPAGKDELPIPRLDRSQRAPEPAVTSANGAITVTQEQERADVEFMGRTMPGLRVVSTTLVFTNTATNTIARADKVANLISGLIVSADGKLAYGITTFNTVTVWDTATGKVARQILTGPSTKQYFLSPDGSSLIVFRSDGTLTSYKATTGDILWTVPGAQGVEVNGSAISPDGATVFGAYGNGTLAAWSLKSGALARWVHDPLCSIGAMALSPDGHKIAATYIITALSSKDMGIRPRNVLRIIDAATFATLKEIPDDDDRFSFNTLTFSPDSALLLATRPGSGSIVIRGSQPIGDPIFIWDATTGEAKTTPYDSFASIETGAYSTDGTQLMIEDGNRVHVYNLPSMELIKHPDQWMFSGSGGAHYVAMSSINHTLIEGTDGGSVRFWKYTGSDIADKGKTVVPHDRQSAAIKAGALSTDETTVATASMDGTLWLWDVNAHTTNARGTISRGGLTSVSFTKDAKRLTVGCADGAIKVVSAADCSIIATLQMLPAISVAVAPASPTPATVASTAPAPAPASAPAAPPRWVTFTPSGSFTGSPGAGAFLIGNPAPKEAAVPVQAALAPAK